MNIIETNLQFNGLAYGNNPKMLVLHHAEASSCTIQDIQQWHLANGWAGCGYHFLIRKDGTVYRGRPEDAIGAHCPGVNATSLGICAEGDFTKEEMTGIQQEAIVDLCKYLCSKYGINDIKGHKELYATECPGTKYPLQGIRNLAGTGGSVTVITSTSTASSSSNLLKLWSIGDAVKDLQAKLNKLGYNLVVDGIFGQNTFNAIEHFQASKGLVVDGIVGPQTMTALNAAIEAKNAIDISTYKFLQHELNVQCNAGLAEDNIPGSKTLAACPLIKSGAQGNITRWIQNHLGINADGIFGNQTKIAIQNFQASHGLIADGIVGQNTWRKLLGL